MQRRSFLSTPSARRATCGDRKRSRSKPISIHALREEGDVGGAGRQPTKDISIHALREEGDLSRSVASYLSTDFYPRPPRGGRQCSISSFAYFGRFLSTPSARRATHTAAVCSPRVSRFLSTPSARRATIRHDHTYQQGLISIHALREEGDHYKPQILLFLLGFLSTPSARRAT